MIQWSTIIGMQMHFFDLTIHADISEQIKAVLRFLPAGWTILDARCNNGRGSLVFMEDGFHQEKGRKQKNFINQVIVI